MLSMHYDSMNVYEGRQAGGGVCKGRCHGTRRTGCRHVAMLFLDVIVPARHQSDGPSVPTPAVEGIERDVRRAVEGGGAQKGARLYYVSLITISGSKSCKFLSISHRT